MVPRCKPIGGCCGYRRMACCHGRILTVRHVHLKVLDGGPCLRPSRMITVVDNGCRHCVYVHDSPVLLASLCAAFPIWWTARSVRRGEPIWLIYFLVHVPKIWCQCGIPMQHFQMQTALQKCSWSLLSISIPDSRFLSDCQQGSNFRLKPPDCRALNFWKSWK